MDTKILDISPINIDFEMIKSAANHIKNGELVAFPTETVYGLGADCENGEAVKNIFKTKGRPMDNPLIVHVSDLAMCERYVEKIPESARILMDKFWGGPLTIVMKRSKYAIDEVTAGGETVAIRLPSHPIAHELIKATKKGIAAPSANLSGKPSPTLAEHVIEDFDGKIPCIISGGKAEHGLESTVIDLSGERPLVLRPGVISLDMIKELLPDAVYGGGGEGIPKSPGMKYKHYAPDAKVIVVKGDMIKEAEKYKGKVLFMDYEDQRAIYNAENFLPVGCDDTSYAASLFWLLRLADTKKADFVLAKDPRGNMPVSDALCNRLYKSAGGNIV